MSTVFQYIAPGDDQISQTAPSIKLQRHWSRLAQEWFVLERVLAGALGKEQQTSGSQEIKDLQEAVRYAIISPFSRDEEDYSRDLRYLAFLLLKQGRGGIIVGNPYTTTSDGKLQPMPYTGLEGYYAGSEQTLSRPGLSREEIVQEEANIGTHLLHTIKQRVVSQNTWARFVRLQHVLTGAEPDVQELRTIQLYWSMIVRQLHVRVYHHPDFELTLSEHIEQIEKLLLGLSERTDESRRTKQVVLLEYDCLLHQRACLSDEEKAQEKQERRRREYIRADRLDAFDRFRDETYRLLTEGGQGRYLLEIQDSDLEHAAITETILLPGIPERTTYPLTSVHLTPEQWEGYLLLSRLGEIGGDPLIRSVLVVH